MTETTTTPAAEARGMTAAEHTAAKAIAAVFDHDSATLADDPDLLARFLRAGKQTIAALVALGEDRTRDDIAERMFDLAHDGCDDGCAGGGKPWYRDAAARLGPHSVLAEVACERQMQDDAGEQNHPDGTGPDIVWAFTGPASYVADSARQTAQRLVGEGYLTFRDVLTEKVAAAHAEKDPVRLRAELVRVAAAACAWVESIDRRLDAARSEKREAAA